MMKSRKLPQIVVRLPRDVKDWIYTQAVKNSSSQNSEIVRAIRERMDRAEAAVGEGTRVG